MNLISNSSKDGEVKHIASAWGEVVTDQSTHNQPIIRLKSDTFQLSGIETQSYR
jgi:hypothetical protein